MLLQETRTELRPAPENKREFVNDLFDRAAPHYDVLANWGFFHTGSWYRRTALSRHGLRPGHQLLDVAAGTGLVAVEAMKILGGAQNITCLDPSEGMLSVARQKLPARFVRGRAEQIPFPDASFDFLTMGYALRHVTTLEDAFREYYRVLAPGGKLLILEITKPVDRMAAFLFRLYFGQLIPGLARIFTRSQAARDMMKYYWETMEASAPPERVLEAMRNVGLQQVRRDHRFGLLSEYTAVKP
jgi:demethylmenaquinone methyltransferase / 2-methoxy-6-polyprenyl-1,4-benzoquinol methylase